MGAKKKLREITSACITHVSLVKKGANGVPFLIVKSDESEPDFVTVNDIIKTDDEKRLVTSIVYEPDVPDSQGDFMKAETIEKTAYDFMENYQNIDINHTFEANENVKIVESYIAKCDFNIGNRKIIKGSWVMTTKINDDAIWKDVKKGNYNGYSMGGTGTKVEVEEEVKKEDLSLFRKFKEFIKLEKAATATNTSTTQSKKFTFDFKTKALAERIGESHWAFRDGLGAILKDPTITDKKSAIGEYIESYKEYVFAEMDSVGIKKCAEQFNEEERDDEMKAEEIKELVKSAVAEQVAPIIEQLEKSLGEEGTKSGNAEEQQNEAELIKSAVAEQLEPVKAMIQKMANTRCVPNGSHTLPSGIEKTDEVSAYVRSMI